MVFSIDFNAFYPVFVDIVDGPGSSHLLILLLPLTRVSVSIALVAQVVPATVE
jgi:hypothetical protein